MKISTVFESASNLFAWWLFAVLAVFANAAWSQVGYVHQASGDVRLQQGTASPQAVREGQTFDPGATFRTAANSRMVIKFQDGQLTSLQPNTTFRIDQYSFNARNPAAGTSAVSLLRGALRFVTGLIGSTNRGNVRLAAGTATIGKSSKDDGAASAKSGFGLSCE